MRLADRVFELAEQHNVFAVPSPESWDLLDFLKKAISCARELAFHNLHPYLILQPAE